MDPIVNGAYFQHYGVKGMRWGVRRTPAQLARARGERFKKKEKTVSPEAQKARETQQKAKREGSQSLSNKELEQLNKRLNLEKNYNDLVNKKTKKAKPLTREEKAMIAWLVQKGAQMYVKNMSKKYQTQNKQISNIIDLRPKNS